MNSKLPPPLKVLVFILFVVYFPLLGKSQGKPKVFFKQGETLRLESNSKSSPDASLTIIVPKNGDTTNKKDVPVQTALMDGKISITLDRQASTVNLSETRLPVVNEFTLDSLKKGLEFSYDFSVPRDAKDDKVMVLILQAFKKDGTEIKDLSKKITVYVKPLISDSLSSNEKFELWLLTGTNFDLFDGIKAQEFFFRANTLFKIEKKLFGQIGFYKNRYNTPDITNDEEPFSRVQKPSQFGDPLFTLMSGKYKRTTKQTIDPLAVQFDVLYKMTDDEESNFFVSTGFDISTTTVTIDEKYEILDTTFYLRTSKPDTVPNYNAFGTTRFSESVSYKKPAYNFNIGFMWILNDKDVNIKAQFTAGYSKYSIFLTSYESRVSGTVYKFRNQQGVYAQLRMFATYKPLGLSFGMESFIRARDVPAFNFTLSKAFDLKGFIKNFSPVSALKIGN